jgi:hypothetical protein
MAWRALAVVVLGVAVGACGQGGEKPAQRPERPDVDPRLTARIPVGAMDSSLTGVAAGEGAVWVATAGRVSGVSRIDPARNEVVAEVRLNGDVGDVAAGAGAVWAPSSTRAGPRLTRIDARKDKVVATLPLARSGDPTGLAVGEGAVWVSVSFDPWTGEVIRIDPQTNEIVARISTRGYAGEMLAHAGAVWVLSHPDYTDETKIKETALHRIDPHTNRLVGTPLRAPGLFLGGSEIAPLLAPDLNAVWVGAFDDKYPYGAVALRIDASTGEVRRLPLAVKRFFPFTMAEGGVWFVGPGADLSRLDPETQRVDMTVALQETIGDAAFHAASRSFWMGALALGRGERSLVLRVDLR